MTCDTNCPFYYEGDILYQWLHISLSFFFFFSFYFSLNLILYCMAYIHFIFILSILSRIWAQSIDSVWFPSNNYTYCNSRGKVNVTSITRYFDILTDTYEFSLTGSTDINITNLNDQGSGMKHFSPFSLC